MIHGNLEVMAHRGLYFNGVYAVVVICKDIVTKEIKTYIGTVDPMVQEMVYAKDGSMFSNEYLIKVMDWGQKVGPNFFSNLQELVDSFKEGGANG